MARRERRFGNASFGPWRLRALIRERLEPGERLIGWGVVQPGSEPWSKFSSAMLAFVPGVGVFLSALSSSQEARRRRVAVLTSRRLVLLRADARRLDEHAVVFDEPLSLLEFEARDAGSGAEPTITVWHSGDQAAAMEVVPGSAKSVDRLREGLLSLAGHDEPM